VEKRPWSLLQLLKKGHEVWPPRHARGAPAHENPRRWREARGLLGAGMSFFAELLAPLRSGSLALLAVAGLAGACGRAPLPPTAAPVEAMLPTPPTPPPPAPMELRDTYAKLA